AFRAATSNPSGRSWDRIASRGTACSGTEAIGVPAARRSRLQGGPERLHGRGPDAVDLVELVDRGEPAVLVAELDDLLGGDRPDPLDAVKLLDRGAAKADWAGLASRRRARCRGAGATDHHLLAVAETRRQVDRVLVGAAGESTGSPDRVRPTGARREPGDTAPPGIPGAVNHDIPGALALMG